MNGLLLSLLLLQGASSIEGTVVQASNQQPLAQTQIVAVPVGGQLKDSRVAVTDTSGKFSIGGLAPGSYRVFFEHDGFLRAEAGQRASGKAGVPVEITAGRNATGLTVSLTAAASIYGRVINASNDPVINATVKALKPSYKDGERSLQAIQSAQTNDLGEYRLFGLTPGNYFLSVTPIPSPSIQGGALTTPSGGGFSVQQIQNILTAGNFIDPRALENGTEPPSYLPGTIDAAAATAIDLKAGTNYRAPDLRTVRTRSFSIRGQFVDEAGQPAVVATSTLIQANSNETVRTNLMSTNRNALEFSGILPGVYVLNAADNGATASKVGSLKITVSNENVENLKLIMRPAIEVKGRLMLEGGSAVPAMRVHLRGVNGTSGLQLNPTAPDGSFTITRIAPDNYRMVFAELPANLYVRSARLGTLDVSNSPIRIEGPVTDQLEIVLGATTGSLDTVVTDRNKQPVGAAIVVLVPSAERRQRFELYRTTTTDSAGRATLTNIAPGNYKLFAWQEIEPNAWQNADALRPFEERGVSVNITDNGKANQAITVIE